MTMSMREEHAEWAHRVRHEIDQRKTAHYQQQLDVGVAERRPYDLDGAQQLAGEENQDRGSWDAA